MVHEFDMIELMFQNLWESARLCHVLSLILAHWMCKKFMTRMDSILKRWENCAMKSVHLWKCIRNIFVGLESKEQKKHSFLDTQPWVRYPKENDIQKLHIISDFAAHCVSSGSTHCMGWPYHYPITNWTPYGFFIGTARISLITRSNSIAR